MSQSVPLPYLPLGSPTKTQPEAKKLLTKVTVGHPSGHKAGRKIIVVQVGITEWAVKDIPKPCVLKRPSLRNLASRATSRHYLSFYLDQVFALLSFIFPSLSFFVCKWRRCLSCRPLGHRGSLPKQPWCKVLHRRVELSKKETVWTLSAD